MATRMPKNMLVVGACEASDRVNGVLLGLLDS
jgi:hypothetical protein